MALLEIQEIQESQEICYCLLYLRQEKLVTWSLRCAVTALLPGEVEGTMEGTMEGRVLQCRVPREATIRRGAVALVAIPLLLAPGSHEPGEQEARPARVRRQEVLP